jgi:predicted transcriptional regulator
MKKMSEYDRERVPSAGYPQSAGPSVVDSLRAIADDKSLVLFNAIALAGGNDTEILVKKIGLTKKQYYSRISAMVRNNLISRKNRLYHLTSFGMIVYDAQMMIGRGVSTFWKLKAIDSLETDHKLPMNERNKIINTLIDNQDIIKILVKES